MPKAIWNGTVLAESESGKMLEGNYYFPPNDVHHHYLRASEKRTTCPWKGEASYYDLIVDGDLIKDVAWSYPTPRSSAMEIQGHIAFSKSIVTVS